MSVFRLASEKGLIPEAVAGHSLGEYSAFVAAGSMPFSDALRLVDLRARLMDECAGKYRGTMAAVIGLGDDEVIRICGQSEGIVVPANFNCPGQVVISGEEKAVEDVSEVAVERGAKRVVKLSVSGAFHSPLMKDAAEGMREVLHGFSISRPNIPVFENVSSEPVWDPERIRELLVKQIESPVMWSQSMFTMIASDVGQFFELGPGNVLSGLMRRIDRRARVKGIDRVDDLEKIP
jgi:[acyl-carrier-protein] S-malonyltransferase